MQRPQFPTLALVRQYVQKFDAEPAGESDKALIELFRAFPENVRSEHVLLKVVALNDLYRTRIEDKYVSDVVQHILRLKVDEKLKQKSPQVVMEIAQTPIKNFYSFATKYCSWHVPEAYPIFDGYVMNLIWKYQKAEKFAEKFFQYKLWDYPQFKRVIDAFREYFGLTDFSYKELDKFLWLYGIEYATNKW